MPQLPLDVDERNHALHSLINPLPEARYTVEVSLHGVEPQLETFANNYGLNLDPDFQCGHVWTPEQRVAFMEGLFRGTVNPTLIIQFNFPHWDMQDPDSDLPDEMQIVDGLQRLTTIRQFMDGSIRPFGLTPSDLDDTDFDLRCSLISVKLAVHTFAKHEDLLSYYLAIHSGDTSHSPQELEQVRGLIEQRNSMPCDRPRG